MLSIKILTLANGAPRALEREPGIFKLNLPLFHISLAFSASHMFPVNTLKISEVHSSVAPPGPVREVQASVRRSSLAGQKGSQDRNV